MAPETATRSMLAGISTVRPSESVKLRVPSEDAAELLADALAALEEAEAEPEADAELAELEPADPEHAASPRTAAHSAAIAMTSNRRELFRCTVLPIITSQQ